MGLESGECCAETSTTEAESQARSLQQERRAIEESRRSHVEGGGLCGCEELDEVGSCACEATLTALKRGDC